MVNAPMTSRRFKVGATVEREADDAVKNIDTHFAGGTVTVAATIVRSAYDDASDSPWPMSGL